MSAHAVIAALKEGIFEPTEKVIQPGFNNGHLLGWGKAKPADGSAGYAPGSLFLDYVGKVAYLNLGTVEACAFIALTQATSLATAIAAALADLVDNGLIKKYTTVASATNVAITADMLNGIVEVTGTTASNLNLPAVAECPAGTWVTFIKNGASGALTIEPNASETVHGAANNNTMDADNDTITIVSNGSEWFITAKNVA